MKKYSKPTTEMFHMNIRTAMLAGSTGLVKQGDDGYKQDLGNAGVLGADDNGGDNLSKGGSLWED